jgi:uncharacterized protein Yka (UPF0111/DUF47 family)
MWVTRAVRWLLPREDHFYEFLERGAACALESSALLSACCNGPTEATRDTMVEKLQEIEHKADRVIVEVYEALNRTFVTPIDRSDIFGLATALERVTDDIHDTALQLVVHAMDDVPAGSRDLAALIKEACEAVHTAVGLLRGLNEPAEVQDRCQLIYRLETDGDAIFRTHIGEMFRTETDAIRLLKHKEFLEGLDETLDACQDVAKALETIVIKNA